MKTHLLIAALLIGVYVPAFAEDHGDAQELLSAAEKQADLFRGAKSPFVLEADFTAQSKTPLKGHITIRWKSKDRWWRKIVLGDYQQINVHDGENLFTARNLGFTPERVGELVNLLQIAGNPDTMIATKQKQTRKDGASLTCVQSFVKGYPQAKHSICVDDASHDIVSDNRPAMQSENKSFSGYTDFEGLRFPRHLELHVNGSRVLSAEITSLAQTDFDEKLLTPPHGSIERRDCENIKPAVPIKTTDPNFSGSNTIMGDTRVALTILADGSVGDVQPIGGASAAMDAEMVRTLKGWRFQPAMCGNDPVVSDIFIVVSVQQH